VCELTKFSCTTLEQVSNSRINSCILFVLEERKLCKPSNNEFTKFIHLAKIRIF